MKKTMLLQKASWLGFVVILVVALSGEFVPLRAEIQDVVDTKAQQDIIVYQGDLVALKVYSLTRIAVSNPGIVDISNADVNEVLLIGRSIGETPIFIWDEFGKRKLMVRVLQEDLDLITARITKLLDSAQIPGVTLKKNGYEGKVVVTGKVLKDQKKQLEDILKPFDAYVLNLAREEVDMIQIDAQISELNTTLDKTLGIDWAANAEDAFRLVYKETLPVFDGSPGDFFKLGDFSRTNIIQATVNALIIEGKGRILSKPSILVSNGEEANLLVGGEIPVRTTTTATGTGAELTENISFKEYGITLNVKPEIIDDSISMSLTVETRDIDAANAAADTAAFITRSAKTKLNLSDGQTIVMAGLIKHSQSQRVKKLPFLGDIPVVGALFRVKSTPTPDQEIELVISLTPRIVKQQKYLDEEAVRKQREKIEKAEPWMDDVSDVSSGGSSSSSSGSGGKSSADETQTTMSVGAGIVPAPDKGSATTQSDEMTTTATKDLEGASKDSTMSNASGSENISKGVTSGADAQSSGKTGKDSSTQQTAGTTTKNESPSSMKEGSKSSTSSSLSAGAMEQKALDQKAAAESEASQKAIAGFSSATPEGAEQVAMLNDRGPVADEKTSQAIMDYAQKVQKKISQSISFPYEAKEKGWQGTVKLTLTILSNGDLNQVSLKESSGKEIFDKDAVNTAQIVAPFDSFPTEIKQQELVITIPIVYNQGNLP